MSLEALMTNDVARQNDDYMTPKFVWEMVAPYLPRDQIIWEAFYGDGSSGQHLTELGFNVIHQDLDFFQHNLGDIIVSNPPFSKKMKVLHRLKELGKPFVLILPASVLGTKTFCCLFPDIQLIIPKGRISFIHEGTQTQSVWFASFFYCWKMNLPRDLIFLP